MVQRIKPVIILESARWPASRRKLPNSDWVRCKRHGGMNPSGDQIQGKSPRRARVNLSVRSATPTDFRHYRVCVCWLLNAAIQAASAGEAGQAFGGG